MKIIRSVAGKSQRGFTLIELMIMVSSVAVLLALALPTYQDYTVRNKVAESLTVVAAVKAAIEEACRTDPTANPSTNSGYSFIPSSFVAAVVITGETCPSVAVTLKTQNTGAQTDPVLSFYRPNSASENWQCVLESGNLIHVPNDCRQKVG